MSQVKDPDTNEIRKITKDPLNNLEIIGYVSYLDIITKLEKWVDDALVAQAKNPNAELAPYEPIKPITVKPQPVAANSTNLMLNTLEPRLAANQQPVKTNPLDQLSYSQSPDKKNAVLWLTVPAEKANELYKKTQSWGLPVVLQDNALVILSSQGRGTRGVYPTFTDLGNAGVLTKIGLAFKNKEDRDAFAAEFGFIANNYIEIPRLGRGDNAIYFDKDSLKQSQSLPPRRRPPQQEKQEAQKEEPKILLYRANNPQKIQLAVKFPDDQTANNFSQQLGGIDRYRGTKAGYTNIFYIPAKIEEGTFVCEFTSNTMRDKFFDLLIVKPGRNISRVGLRDEGGKSSIIFNDMTPFQPQKNITLPVPNALKSQPENYPKPK